VLARHCQVLAHALCESVLVPCVRSVREIVTNAHACAYTRAYTLMCMCMCLPPPLLSLVIRRGAREALLDSLDIEENETRESLAVRGFLLLLHQLLWHHECGMYWFGV